MKAVQSGSISIVKLLLENGAKIEERNDTGQTALHIATLNGNLEMIQVLLKVGINIKVRDNNNITVLHYVARTRDEAISRILI
jgi:ankyrin repeat protein